MKIYTENKNFIPEIFYKQSKINSIKRENQILILFLSINILLAPILMLTVNEFKINSLEEKEKNYNSVYTYSNMDNIKAWIENIVPDYVEEAQIVNNRGYITLKDFDKINLDNKIKINNLEGNNDEEIYKLGVSIDE